MTRLRFTVVLLAAWAQAGCLCGPSLPCVGPTPCAEGLVCLAVTPSADGTCDTKTCEHPCLGDRDCEYFTKDNLATSCKPIPAACGNRMTCQR